jgi:predicted outer membrane repeat protein
MRPVQPAHAADVIVRVCDVRHLQAAIDAAPAGGTVTFACDGTVTGYPPIHVDKPLTIDGGLRKVIIKGSLQSPFQVLPHTVGTAGVTLRNLTFDDAGTSLVTNTGTLTVVNTTFRNGKAIYGPCPPTFPNCPIRREGASGSGGGIFNTNNGTLTVIHGTFSQNQAFTGGAIYSLNGRVTVLDSTFSGNTADLFGSGGGIDVQTATLTVVNSTFSGNRAGYLAGGILNEDGTVMVSGSTFVDNVAGAARSSMRLGSGAGIFSGGTLTIMNSTFSGNLAMGTNSYEGLYSEGGGIANHGHATVENSTFSGNSAVLGSSVYDADSEGRNDKLIPGTLTLRNTILAHPNGGGNCVGEETGAEIIDGGGNVEDGTSCHFAPSSSNVSLDLGRLGRYGGPTQTFAEITAQPPLSGHPCTPGGLDQRGYYLPFAVCLPGAYGYDAIQPTGTLSMAMASPMSGTSVISATVSGAVLYTNPYQRAVSVPYPSSLVRPSGTVTFYDPTKLGLPVIPCAEGDPVTHAVPLLQTASPETVTCTISGPGPAWVYAEYSGDSIFRGSTATAFLRLP